MSVIGIDVGSSSIKGVVFDGQEILRSERIAMPPRLEVGESLKFEHEASKVRDETFALIRRLARHQPISAIAFTGQMHGGLIADKDLHSVTNFVTWQDRRTNAKLETLRNALGNDPTGVGIHPGFLIATVADWITQNALPKDRLYVLGIYDWIASLLAGRPVTDVGSAAAWGMFDPLTKQWRNSVLEIAGIPSAWLPRVYEPGTAIGRIEANFADELGLDANTVVCAGCGDTQATYWGSGCEDGALLLNFGTGSQSMWQTANPVKSKGIDIRYLSGDRFIATSPTEAGGEAYRILAEFLRDVVRQCATIELSLEAMYERMNAAALENGRRGVVFDPAFAGSKVRQVASASIDGLTRENFWLGNVTCALLDGMISEIAGPYFEREGKRRPERLIGSGTGMHKNPALQKAAEHAFGMPIELSPTEEEAALGAAKLCLLAQKAS